MIDITQAQANQTTTNGQNEDWIVSLSGEVIYKLPAKFSVQDTFLVRDVVEKMMKIAAEDEKKSGAARTADIIKIGDSKLEMLAQENERISNALQQHLEVA